MNGLRHAVVVRLHYQPDDPKFDWRLAFFRAMVLPRLISQRGLLRHGEDFEIWVVCHPQHVQKIEALGNVHVVGLPDFSTLGMWTGQALADALPRFDIQTALDSDDLVSLDYIARIQEEVGKSLERTLIVSFQPYKVNLLDLRRYVIWERYYEQQCSMFWTLYTPPGEEYRSVLEFDHSFAWKWCPNVVTIPEGYCDMAIHGTNLETGLEPHRGEVKC